MRKKHGYDDSQRHEKSADGTASKIGLLLIGGGVGAIIALLFAPKAGHELRGDIADASRKGLDKAKEKAQELKEQTDTYYQQVKEQVKEQAETLANRAADAYKAVSGKQDAAVGTSNKVLNAAASSSTAERKEKESEPFSSPSDTNWGSKNS
jgi:gas vesicle protein